ncbi:MAG: sulfite exporter TauE/SafE family protein [Hyphomicrobiales bacterium]
MMNMALEFYIIGAIAVLMTGISKSGFAGGLGVLAVPAMSLFVTPQMAAAIILPILVAMDIANVWRYRRDWVRRAVYLLVPGAIIGIGIGAATFHLFNPAMLKIGIGLLALWFFANFLLQGRRSSAPRSFNGITITLAGMISGLTSFIAHAGGPPVKGYLLSQNLEKSQFVGTNGVFFFLVNSLKVIPYVFLGQLTTESLQISLAFAPFVPVGIFIGFHLHKVVSQTVFTRVAYGFLLLSGFKLLWDGIAGVL